MRSSSLGCCYGLRHREAGEAGVGTPAENSTSRPHLFVRGWPLTHSVPKNRTPGSVSPEACLSLHRLSLNPVLRSDPQLGLYLNYTIPHVPYTYKIHTKL
jgi:hypothetical protein